MRKGDIVFLPTNRGFIKYRIKKVIDDTLVVASCNSKHHNWLPISDVIDLDTFLTKYQNEQVL